MKLLLLSLLMAMKVQGQKDTTVGKWFIISSSDMTLGGTTIAPPTYDTIPVIMLVCDTAPSMYPGIGIIITDEGYSNKVYWIRGYEVRTVHCCVNGNTSNLAYYQPENYYLHHKYLNSNKEALKPSVVVWMARN